jgi:serine/threonine protein kinase
VFLSEFGQYSLRTMLRDEVLTDVHRQLLAERLVAVTRHLHACQLVHTDIRPDHFFLVGGTWKLMDLSRSLAVGEPLPSTRGSQPTCYYAPEVAELALRLARANDDIPSAAAPSQFPALSAHESLDVWGLGLAVYELFSSGGQPLFGAETSHVRELAERSAHLHVGHVRPASARHLLEKMLRFEPGERATCDEVAHHAWLAGGMDTTELESSFSGMQQAQELTQRQLGRVQAGLGRKQ